jgi:phosphate transport system substrate-binding protein
VRDSEPTYRAATFRIDTTPESEGGELAIANGAADVAGIANQPRPETLRSGVNATLIGRDAIAVIVNDGIPVRELGRDQLRAIFTGGLASWAELGGPDVPIRPFIVGAESATHRIFRAWALAGAEYAGCAEVRPDREIVERVAAEPGAIGHISFSFLDGPSGVHPVAVAGELPSVTNLDYPISRPLYLLWRSGNPAVERFVEWTQGESGQDVVMRRFVGTGVVGSVRAVLSEAGKEGLGTLVVRTERETFMDGDLAYFPHRPYEILSRDGARLREVPNRIGDHDETPERVQLSPGSYLIRTHTARRGRVEVFVTIDSGTITEVDIEQLLRRSG